MATEAKTEEEVVFEYRVEQFAELGFSVEESKALADARSSDGTPVHPPNVARALEAGCTHTMALRIFV